MSTESLTVRASHTFKVDMPSRTFPVDISAKFNTDQITPPLTPSSPKEEFLYKNGTVSQGDFCDLDAPTVAVIGVGYVGYHLVERFGSNYPTIAFDISETRLSQIRDDLNTLPNVFLTTSKSELSRATHFLVSVPTTLHTDNTINTTYLAAALKTVREYARPGAVVVVESSVAVGMTRSLLKDLVEEKGILGGMSPERVDPGRSFPALHQVPKIISGLNQEALQRIEQLYQPCFETLVKVSSCEVAEMTKLYENCQRMINIAYANEMADAAQSIGLDPYEVAAAAATKPFGYMPYSPSMGVGGHCIPCNPYYLTSNLSFPLLQRATETMAKRPSDIADSLINKSRSNEDRVLVVGIGFKRGESVLSHSPGLAFARRCQESGAQVNWYDPVVGSSPAVNQVSDLTQYDGAWSPIDLATRFDLVVVCVNQKDVDWSVLRTIEAFKGIKVEWRIQRPE